LSATQKSEQLSDCFQICSWIESLSNVQFSATEPPDMFATGYEIGSGSNAHINIVILSQVLRVEESLYFWSVCSYLFMQVRSQVQSMQTRQSVQTTNSLSEEAQASNLQHQVAYQRNRKEERQFPLKSHKSDPDRLIRNRAFTAHVCIWKGWCILRVNDFNPIDNYLMDLLIDMCPSNF
jgi:hypothetical protein